MIPDYPLGQTLDFKFTTRSFSTGAPTTLSGTPAISVYEDNSVTEITAGITLTADFDSRTGLNNVRIVATGGNGYESGKSYAAVITAGTVGGVSVVGEVVAQFTIERSAAAVDLANGTDGLGAIKSDTAAILTDTAEIGAAGAGLTAIPWNASWDAEVQSEVNDALVALHLDHLLAVDYDPAAKPGVATALLNELIESDAGVSRFTANALEQVWTVATRELTGNANFNDPTAAAIADAVWDEAQSGHVGAGSFGEIATEIADILADTADMQPKLGTIADLGGGATVGANLSDMAGATFATGTDSLEAIRDRGDAAWTTGAGGSPPDLLQSTTIATLSTQTSFTLTAGSADNDAYNGAIAVITDATTAEQKAIGLISDYVGSTKTVTLAEDPGIFVMAAGDNIDIIAAPKQLPDAVHGANGGLPTVDANNRIAGIQGTINDFDGLNDPTAAAVADAVWDESTAGHTSAGTFGEQVKTDIDAILLDTAEIGSAGAGLTAIPWNSAWDAEVESEVNDALVALHLDHLLAVDYDPASKPGVATALLNELIESDAGVSRFTANALEQVWGAGTRTLTALGFVLAAGDFGASSLNGKGDWNVGKTGYSLSAAGIDGIWDEGVSEPAGVFAWGSATPRNILGWLGALGRNKMTQTSTTATLRNDADSANIATSTVSDDGTTYTSGEWT